MAPPWFVRRPESSDSTRWRRSSASWSRSRGGLSTLVAGVVLGAFAHLVDAAAKAPPRLVLLLGGFFVLTVGGLGVRGVTSFFGGDVVSGLQNLADFGLQVPTVALALGVILSDRWKARVDR